MLRPLTPKEKKDYADILRWRRRVLRDSMRVPGEVAHKYRYVTYGEPLIEDSSLDGRPPC